MIRVPNLFGNVDISGFLSRDRSLVEAGRVDMARGLMQKAGKKLVLPGGAVIAQKLEAGVPARAVMTSSPGW